MFGMQQNFECEMKNKDNAIKAIEKERHCLERELETSKELVNNLKTSVQAKSDEISNVTHLHDEAKKLLKEIEEKLVKSNESLREEKSKNKTYADNIGSHIEDIQALGEQNKLLKTDQLRSNEEKRTLLEEIGRLNEHIECLQNEVKESEKNNVQLEESNAKLTQSINDKQFEVRNLEKNDAELRSDIEKVRKEVVLVRDQKHALEAKMTLVQEEIKNVERRREKLEYDLIDSKTHLKRTEENFERTTIQKGELEEEAKVLEEVISKLNVENKKNNESLEEVKTKLEQERKEKQKLNDAVKALEQVICDLTNSSKKQNSCLEQTKQELDEVIGTKQQMLSHVEMLKDTNKDLKKKISTLSQDIESMQDLCDTKTRQFKDLEQSSDEKSKTIQLHEKKERELQSQIEELLSMEEIRASELTNSRKEISKLRKEKVHIVENYETINVQLQQSLKELKDSNEMYIKSNTQNEKQVEELTRFRELTSEINEELKNRNDEISLLTLEKAELERELTSMKNLIENNSLKQSSLHKQKQSIEIQMEKYKESENEASKKLSEAKKKLEIMIKEIDNERDEKCDLELQLKYTREKAEQWKKLSFEIKEERNRLQMQISELDKDLNEKHLNLAEEKSTLEKEIQTLKNLVKRLKSNEEKLREKVDELRDNIDKLSDVSSEQEMEIRKLSWENRRMTENIERLKSAAQENASLQNLYKETSCENKKLNDDVHALQEKAMNAQDKNETLQKDFTVLQDQFYASQARVLEETQEKSRLKHEYNVLKDNISELMEEKERLFNESCRLKEKKNSIIQDRNKLKDIMESLDKCHNEKTEELSRQNALLEKELASHRSVIMRSEDKELKLVNEIQELNERIEKSVEENDEISSVFRKTNNENIRLRKKIVDLSKLVQQMEQERESRINLETELNGREKLFNKHKESMKKLNELISSLNHEQIKLKEDLHSKERELVDLNKCLEREKSDRLQCESTITKLEEDLETKKTSELKYIDEMQREKVNSQTADLALTNIKREMNDFQKIARRKEDEHEKKIKALESETLRLLHNIEELKNESNKAKGYKDNSDKKIKKLEEEICTLKNTKRQLTAELEKKDERLLEMEEESNALEEEKKQLEEQADNINMILSLKNSAVLDQASGFKKEIKILHDTLAKLQNTRDINRSEIDKFRRKLKISNEDRMNTEVKLNENLLKLESLESKNKELVNICTRLENVVKEVADRKLEKEDREQSLMAEQKKNRTLNSELVVKTQELFEKECVLKNLEEEILEHKKKIEKLNASKKELIASLEGLTQNNNEDLEKLKILSEMNKQLLSENNRLTELVVLQKEEIEKLKRETDLIKTEMQLKTQEAENENFQLQSDANMREENLQWLTERNNELQENIKNAKEEVDDLEHENEHLLAEADQLKELNKKSKELYYALQTEHNALQEEQREKENNRNKEKEKLSLDIFKMESDITNLNDRLTRAHERNEKQCELEKMLRLEIDELSESYIELEKDVQHRNQENIALKEKLQALSENIDELELARDTACLLKEKRHYELQKSERNAHSLEKQVKEKQRTNKRLQKELDAFIEREQCLQLQISSEKELSDQRLKQIQDLQNLQHQIDEQLWKAKRDVQKLVTEIETWRTSSESMNVRIETLDDELNKVTNEKHIILKLYEETKKINEANEDQIAGFETIVCEKKQEINRFEELLHKKSEEVTNMEELVKDMGNKYEKALSASSLLHKDIQIKDERIVDLEEWKKQVITLLTDLDLKIAKIQVQAEALEGENESLGEQLIKKTKSEENLRIMLENEQHIYVERYAKAMQEIRHLQEDCERLSEEKHCLSNTKVTLENKLQEKRLEHKSLKQTLIIEKEKTVKQSLEMQHLLTDYDSLKVKFSLVSKKQKESKKKLIKANSVCQKLEDSVKEKNGDVLKIQECCKNWTEKAHQLEESVASLRIQTEEHLQIKDEEIRSMDSTNRKLKNTIDKAKSELEKETERNTINDFKINRLKNKLEQKRKHLNDIELHFQSMVNSKNLLEIEKSYLLEKLKTTSQNLETLENGRQELLTENAELDSIVKAKERELKEHCITFRQAEKKVQEEILNHKTTLENLLSENNTLQQTLNTKSTQLKKTENSMEELNQKLEDQVKENKRLNNEVQNLTFERDCLDDANSKVNYTLDKLKNDSVICRKQQENNTHLDTEKRKIDAQNEDTGLSWHSKQVYATKSSNLQNNLLLIENEIFSLRSLICCKEKEIDHLQVYLNALNKEIHDKCSQVSDYKQRLEEECKQHENALEIIKQLQANLELSNEVKSTSEIESQTKLINLQQELNTTELLNSNLQQKNLLLEARLNEMKALDEEKTLLRQKLEKMEQIKKQDFEDAHKLIEKTILNISNLEDFLNIHGEKNGLKIRCISDSNYKDTYDQLGSLLASKFKQIFQNIQSRLEKEEKLEKDLTDAENQSSVYRTEIQAVKIAYGSVKVECGHLQKQLTRVTFNCNKALSEVSELSKSLLAANTNMEGIKILQKEENGQISHKLQEMQRELTLVCETFKSSISKAKSLEENIKTKEKHILDLEESLKTSICGKRMFEVKIAELETTNEFLQDTIKDLENTEKKHQMKMETLRFSLQQEKNGRNKDLAQQAKTISQLELKNEFLQEQIENSKELLGKSEKTIKKLEAEIDTLQNQKKETEAVITNLQSKVLQLGQNMSNLQMEISRLQNDYCTLTKTNESLFEKFGNLEKKNMDYLDTLKQNEHEKQLQNESLEKLFAIALNEKVNKYSNDKIQKLEIVTNMIKDLKKSKETLTNEKQHVLENLLQLKKHHAKFQETSFNQYGLLQQCNSKLTEQIRKLETELEGSELKFKQLSTTIHDLEENIETMKVNEEQQQYQYGLLERERDYMENEVTCLQERVKTLTEKLKESMHRLHEFHPALNSSGLDDSGIASDDNSTYIISNHATFDSGVFTDYFGSSNTFSIKSEDARVENENMRALEMAVNAYIKLMTNAGAALDEKSMLFSVQEQKLNKEIQMLNESSVQNKVLLSSLEEEVERLELSQKSLQETYQEKDADLKECQNKLKHSLIIANEKELSIAFLQESVQKSIERQETLETERNKVEMANEQLSKDKLQIAITLKEYEKVFEEARQKRLEDDAKNENTTKNLRLTITELESKILEKQNANLELQGLCETLRKMVDKLNNCEKQYSSRITWFKCQIQDLEKKNDQDIKQMEDLQELMGKQKGRIVMLETIREETQETIDYLTEKLQRAMVHVDKSCKEIMQLKENNICIKRERDFLENEVKLKKEELKNKQSTIEHISSELRQNDKKLTVSEGKVKLLQELMDRTNQSNDNFEKGVDGMRWDENDAQKKQVETVKYENNCFVECVKMLEGENIEKNNTLDKKNTKIKHELLANHVAHQQVNTELHMSLAELKKINNVINDFNNLLDSKAVHYFSTSHGHDNMDPNAQILPVCRKINYLILAFHKMIMEHESQKNFEENELLLENKKSALKREKEHLNEKITTLSKELVNLKLSFQKQMTKLNQSRNQLSAEKKSNGKLCNMNRCLQEKVKLLKEDISCISIHSESLKTNHGNLNETLMNTQDEVENLSLKCEQVDALDEELSVAKRTIKELYDYQEKKQNSNDKELENSKQLLVDLQTAQTEQTQPLTNTEVILEQQKDRIVTLAEAAGMKEYDLENAKILIKLKDELIRQIKSESQATHTVFKKLQALQMLLIQTETSLMQLQNTKKLLMNNISEILLANKEINNPNGREEEKRKIFLQHICKLEDQNEELTKLCEKLQEKCHKVEEFLSNESSKTAEVLNELPSSKEEKQRLCELNKGLKARRQQCLEKNDNMHITNEGLRQQMCEKVSDFQEKGQSDQKIATTEELINVLKEDLKASVGFSKQRVEKLHNQVSVLESSLRISLNQIKEMNSKIVLVNEEINQTDVVLGKKEQKMALLCQEDKGLKKKVGEIDNHKSTGVGIQRKREETELLLQQSIDLFDQEKQLTSNFRIEKHDFKEELLSTIMKLQGTVDELVLEFSLIKANEHTRNKEENSADDTIKKLEMNVKEQTLKMKENEEEHVTKAKEPDSARSELDKICQGSKELHQYNQQLKQDVEPLETEISLNNQKTYDLKVHRTKLMNKKEEAIEYILESKTAEIQQISEKLFQEKDKTEELQSKINTLKIEKTNLEQGNEFALQEISSLCESFVMDLKTYECAPFCDDSFIERPTDSSATDVSQIIGTIRSLYAVMKNKNNQLNLTISELNQRLNDTTNENKTLLIQKTKLENELKKVERSSEVQSDRNTIAKILETRQHNLKLKRKNFQLLENEIKESQHQRQRFQEKIQAKEDEYMVLGTKHEVMEDKAVLLENEVERFQSELVKAIIELTTVQTSNENKETSNREFVSSYSRLTDDRFSFQTICKHIGTKSNIPMENLSLKEIGNLKLQMNEICDLTKRLNEIEKDKCDFENEVRNLRTFHKKIESCLQRANSEIHGLEYKQSENLKQTTHMQVDLEITLAFLEEQNSKLCQVQSEKEVLQNQLLAAEKELKVIMEDNADLKHQVYQYKMADKGEL